jgi:hypothetical protein
MRIEKVIVSKNSLRMPMQCKDWLRATPYKGVSKANWAINAKRAAKRGVVRVYKPNAVGEMVLTNRI